MAFTSTIDAEQPSTGGFYKMVTGTWDEDGAGGAGQVGGGITTGLSDIIAQGADDENAADDPQDDPIVARGNISGAGAATPGDLKIEYLDKNANATDGRWWVIGRR